MEFAALDVETANADLGSICQVGVAFFRDGRHVDSYSALVDPEGEFDAFNVDIHGITEADVRGAPTWPQIAEALRQRLDASVVACHTPFDQGAVRRACERYGLSVPVWQWLDTARVVRRAWPDRFGARGYGLRPVSAFLGIRFEHHDALEDARAAGEVLCRASGAPGLTLADWQGRVRRPIDLSTEGHVTRLGDCEGPLFGQIAVFTGSLEIPRRHAADLAAKAGCDVAASVSKKTTLLIVGDQDARKLAGKTKSAKHLKAEALIAKGYAIRVLRESDFKQIVETQAIC
ncbi:exonuclease domain-containing protein [Luteimonas sp. FCS-9]|uniref:exonuclease domain-containing protein n=1 Tax=Luteimonas sp. FCS-9 TaxID=1547516 RepID=UPI00063EAA18|nr:exonuclease domain-containing protein [Luteimonas sp. FCS-9]KLJ01306.1 hypothetical protein WQ56_05870 [Luteimonas sp. FCS-9]